MLFEKDVKDALGVEAEMSEVMTGAIDLWSKMYRGEAPWLGKGIKSLNLPCIIASEIARLTTIEMRSEISGDKRAEFLNGEYQRVLKALRQYVEYGCAKGGLVMKPYVIGRSIVIDYIQADGFCPVEFDASGRVTGAVFTDCIKKGGKVYTRFEYHSMRDGGCLIKNVVFKSENGRGAGACVPLSEIDEWTGLEPEAFIKNIDRPLFAYFKVPIANTADAHSPLGVSVFSRAVELIEEADRQYSRLLWEFESGERALYVADGSFKKDESGQPVFPHRRLYRSVGTSDPDLFKDWSPTIREQSIINGLDSILVKIEDACGLARGTLSNPQGEARTATELKILRQRSYATVADTQKALQSALEDLVYAMDVWCTLYKLAPAGRIETSLEFDDSIVTDRAAEFVEKKELVEMGAMQTWEMRAWYLGESEEKAKEAISSEQVTGNGYGRN